PTLFRSGHRTALDESPSGPVRHVVTLILLRGALPRERLDEPVGVVVQLGCQGFPPGRLLTADVRLERGPTQTGLPPPGNELRGRRHRLAGRDRTPYFLVRPTDGGVDHLTHPHPHRGS